MGFAEHYLSKHGFSPQITPEPEKDLGMIMVIPCINEPDLITNLTYLTSCDQPEVPVEIIIVLNSSEKSSEVVLWQNRKTLEDFSRWELEHQDSFFSVHLIHSQNIKKKHAGAGTARKIGMDEAAFRFSRIEKPEGIILSYDADCRCEKNYFTEIYQQFKAHPKASGATIYFEHPIVGVDFKDEVYNAIIQYEIYLRYFVQALRWAEFPYAWHTVGSSFAVRAATYVNHGGMNRKQAGEDFYFLQKIFPHGHILDITTTRVIPSSRPSDRVPFGTGAMISHLVNQNISILNVYDFELFKHLKDLFQRVDDLFRATDNQALQLISNLNYHLAQFLSETHFFEEIREINANCATLASFRKRFFQNFNAFRIIKYLNGASEHSHYKKDVVKMAVSLLSEKGISISEEPIDILTIFRGLDRLNNENS